ncbi:MAG: hypothetical protein ACRD8Z_04105 [Nitrososphaeraceae archaeon]
MIRVSIATSIPSVALFLFLSIFVSFGYETEAQSEGSSTSKNVSNTIIDHYHSQLNVTVNGETISVPARIGIDPSLWKYHELDKYGMQSMNMAMPAMAPLHTMDNSANIVVETSVDRNYTLGEFLKIWGINFHGRNVEIIVDGKSVNDYNNHILKEDNKNHLEVIIDGQSIQVPARIGIDPSLWKYHNLDKYGMQSMNMVMSGMAPLHTHDDSGTIHIETSVNRNYTLGEFLKIWGIDLDGKTVKASVDGKAITDLENQILKDAEGIIFDIETNNKT